MADKLRVLRGNPAILDNASVFLWHESASAALGFCVLLCWYNTHCFFFRWPMEIVLLVYPYKDEIAVASSDKEVQELNIYLEELLDAFPQRRFTVQFVQGHIAMRKRPGNISLRWSQI